MTTLTFDENITAATAIIKLKLFEGNSPRDRQATIPALFEPGITQGEVKIRSKNLAKGTQASEATLEPAIMEEQAQASRVEITVKDGKGEEITCAQFGDIMREESLLV